ncbi:MULTISPECIES: hypothetical protein [Enterobacter]|jgi:hypothetical protein|uniref:hypothetical protein n=1 Tax=Enterobacter TaxID=547 RepID=UPI000EF9A7B2|nr:MULTISPECIES: hypothetical protein [Enterobacter]RMA89417.1 hypothetical protein BJ885_1375 [Enterobacter sp. WP_7_1]RMA99385.1 hypothetical protein BJ886_1471 [Enterobacter sp. WP_7_2]WNI51463.1 hypothetical protein RIK63_09100 [Enterobacter asburiae]
MSPQEFIHKNITSELIRLRYDENAAMTGADMAVDHYRRCSQASRKGRIFDDCLYIAKQWAGKHKSKQK